MKQRLIQSLDELQVGDEIIISSYSNLKYLKIIQLPRKQGSSRFKVSTKQIQRTSGNWSWTENSFEQNTNEHNHITYQDLYNRHIFLVKRENS